MVWRPLSSRKLVNPEISPSFFFSVKSLYSGSDNFEL